MPLLKIKSSNDMFVAGVIHEKILSGLFCRTTSGHGKTWHVAGGGGVMSSLSQTPQNAMGDVTDVNRYKQSAL